MQSLKELFMLLNMMVGFPLYGLFWIVGFMSMVLRVAWTLSKEGFLDGHRAADFALMDACTEPEKKAPTEQ